MVLRLSWRVERPMLVFRGFPRLAESVLAATSGLLALALDFDLVFFSVLVVLDTGVQP